MTRAFRCLLTLGVVATWPSYAQQQGSRIHKLEELRYPQVAALDRERTMFVLPIGMLEEHGPHLPIGADTLGVTYEADAVANTPGWQGYLSVPAKATAAYGRDIETWWIDGQTDVIVRAVNGENLRTIPRAPQMDPAMQGVFSKSLGYERAFDAKLEAWLARRQQPSR